MPEYGHRDRRDNQQQNGRVNEGVKIHGRANLNALLTGKHWPAFKRAKAYAPHRKAAAEIP
jgi:hypothetical protein